MANYIQSSKSKPLLSLNGFLYYQHSKNKKGDRQYWRCTERDRCNARCTTNVFNPQEVLADGTNTHTHPEIQPEIRARETVQRIKRRAEENPNEPPSQVIAAEVEDENDDEVLAYLPERQTLRRAVNRAQNRFRPNNPGDLSSLEIVHPYTETKSHEKFLHYDSGPDSESRLLIFTTEKNLRKLCDSPMIFSNGTFKTAPDMFTQMFTIHGIYREHLFPFVYALTINKNEGTYNLLYQELKKLASDYGLSLRPETMMCDFELANMNAVRAHFPGIDLRGCLFHFGQNVWRHAEDNGLKGPYKNDEEIRKQIQYLLGLPFVPVEDIPEVFDSISDEVTSAEVAAVYKTVEVTYVHGIVARGRRRAVPPRYPPKIWCAHEAVLHDQHRTNNMVEGFHNKFQKSAQVQLYNFLH